MQIFSQNAELISQDAFGENFLDKISNNGAKNGSFDDQLNGVEIP